MANQQLQLVCDSSTLANFKQWAMAISSWFSTCGWTQSTDTGQVNWSTIVSVPTTGTYVYEVWKPADALAAFYAKIEYGHFSNSPSLRISVGQTTNGAGLMTGLFIGPLYTSGANFGAPSTTTQYECNFTGDTGRMGVMMYRNASSNAQQLFSIERSLNSSGTYTSSYVTVIVVGYPASGNTNWPCAAQQSLVFGVGFGPTIPRSNVANSWAGPALCVRACMWQLQTSGMGAGIPFDTVAPSIGYFDYPGTHVGISYGIDIVEGAIFTATLYGATRTYLPGKLGPFANAATIASVSQNGAAVCLRYD